MERELYREQLDILTERMRVHHEPDGQAMAAARRHLDAIAKPLDGLGLFEGMITRIAGMQGTEEVRTDPAVLLILCADNGIVEEGVTQSDAKVTAAVAGSMARGTSSVCRMAASCGTDIRIVDIGIREVIGAVEERKQIRDCRIRSGTRDFLKTPAMTPQEAMAAIQCGIRLAEECAAEGYRLLLTGEMGIGNTTTSAAMAAVLTGTAPELVTGRGAGLDDAGLLRKREVIRDALQKYGFSACDGGCSDPEEAFRLLCCVGGLDIAGLTGIFLGGCLYGIPVVIDGVISAVAALTAEILLPGCRGYMLPSHQGKEPAMRIILNTLDLQAPIHAELALGEGTGAVMLVPLLRMALAVYHGNTGFDALGMDAYERHAR